MVGSNINILSLWRTIIRTAYILPYINLYPCIKEFQLNLYFFYQQMLNMQFNADKGLVLSSKSPQINNSENPKIGCFPKFAPILIWIIRIFNLVHSNTKKIRMVNSSRMSEGEGPTCQKVFLWLKSKEFHTVQGSKPQRLCGFKTTIGVVGLN